MRCGVMLRRPAARRSASAPSGAAYGDPAATRGLCAVGMLVRIGRVVKRTAEDVCPYSVCANSIASASILPKRNPKGNDHDFRTHPVGDLRLRATSLAPAVYEQLATNPPRCTDLRCHRAAVCRTARCRRVPVQTQKPSQKGGLGVFSTK